ncbi:MAG TPA: hypothetical protein VIB39_23150 [Candidatus Angelobacter sp.]|jgi:hypothetical protein
MMNHDMDLLIKKMAAEHQPQLPSPGLVWWRAQILKKQAQKERIERPVTIMRMVAAALCLVVVVALWLSQGSKLWQLLDGSVLLALLPVLVGGAVLTAAILAVMWRITARV